MLIEFRVENHRSIRNEQVLTMEAGRVGASDDPTPRTVPGCSEKILPVAALYGANASGKSNVLAALAFMKEAVIYSHRSWSPDEGIPRDPFAWGQKRSEPSMFEVEIVIDGVRYRYGFRLNDEVFLEEWLYAWPNGKKQTWLERDGENFEYGKHLMGENKVIEGVTRTNALFLSAAAQLKHPQLTPIFSWFGSIATINLPNRRTSVGRGRLDPIFMLMDEERDSRQPTLFGDDEAPDFLLSRFKSLLMNADVGIMDMRIRNENSITVRIGKTGTPCAHGTKTFSGRATKALGNHPIVPLREVVVKEDRHVLFESRRRFRSGRIITRNDIHSDCQARLRLSSLDQFLD